METVALPGTLDRSRVTRGVRAVPPRRRLDGRLAVLGGLVLLFAAARLWRLDAPSLDGDECFRMIAATADWPGLWREARNDISHPPLFYFLLKIWVGLGGEGLLWVRLLPWLIAMAGLPAFFRLCRELGMGIRETSLALALMAVNGTLIFYAQHLRNFILLQTLSLWAFWLVRRYAGEEGPGRRSLRWLFVVNLLAIWAHYWGFVLVAVEFVALLHLRRARARPFFLAMLLLLVGYAPWAWAAVGSSLEKGSATSQMSWIAKPSLGDLIWFMVRWNGQHYFDHAVR